MTEHYTFNKTNKKQLWEYLERKMVRWMTWHRKRESPRNNHTAIDMKKGAKWAIGLSTAAAVMLICGVAAARYALAVVSAVASQGVFYNNGWSMIDSDWEEYMGYISEHGIDQEDLDYETYLEQREGGFK